MFEKFLDTIREYNCYNYFDSPDGEDIKKKIYKVTVFYGIPTGLFLGVGDVLLNSKPRPYFPTINRILSIFIPFGITVPLTFITTANLLAINHERDEKFNWAIAAATTSLLHVWFFKRSLPMCLGTAAFAAFGSAAVKYCFQENVPVFSPAPGRRRPAEGIRIHDYTLTKNIPGNYEVKPCKNGRGIPIAEKLRQERELVQKMKNAKKKE